LECIDHFFSGLPLLCLLFFNWVSERELLLGVLDLGAMLVGDLLHALPPAALRVSPCDDLVEDCLR
jgi:hypothetical protein